MSVIDKEVPASKTCGRTGCNECSLWRVKLLFFAPHALDPKGEHPMEALTGLGVCEGHRDDVKVEDLLNEELKDIARSICKQFNKAMPDFKRTRVAFDRLSAGAA